MKHHLHRLSLFLLILSLVFSIFFLFKVREENQLVDELIDIAVKSKNLTDRDQIAISLSREIYRRTNKGLNGDDLDVYSLIESTSFFNVTAAVSLKYGGYSIKGDPVYGRCGTMTRTLLNALWRLKIPARKLQLLNKKPGIGGHHVMIEFYQNDAWRVLSPSDRTFVWRTEGGEVATARQIQNNPTVFSQIYTENPNFPYLFDNLMNIRWEKLPNWITAIIKFVVGESKFKSMETPKLYDLPRYLLLYCSIFATILFSIFAYVSRPKTLLEEHITMNPDTHH